ncbi:MAG: hypothetical protein KDK70_31265, partial [Myxococcales bacterium]|nr:hypothetical protein [Myxococcales bacterium]
MDAIIVLGLGGIGCFSTGCRGDDIDRNCELYGLEYYGHAEEEATPLLPTVPDRGPYPVALHLTEE